MMEAFVKAVAFACLMAVVSCRETPREPSGAGAPSEEHALLKAGPLVITQQDLDYQLHEKHDGRNDPATRQRALDELAQRASFTWAALDAGLDSDPLVKYEIARILTNRLKELELSPRLKELAGPVPEERLREIYQAEGTRFQSAEKRQVAVLWLNPGADPGRTAQYQEKLAQARKWFLENGDIKDHPEQGFSVLSVDYSEHAASRYKGGVVGWLGPDGGMTAWNKAVAEIAFSQKNVGEVSEVITRPEGVFLVRTMALKPAEHRPFEAVTRGLEQAERQRIRTAAENDFTAAILEKFPVQRLTQ